MGSDMKHGTITLVTGGARSGKSSYALESARLRRKKVFLATATPCDDEMKTRIAAHRRERGKEFLTIEEPLDPARVLHTLPEGIDLVIVDCLTVWLGNLMHKYGVETEAFPEIAGFLGAIKVSTVDLIIVTNEVGMGIVPDNEAGRHFRDIAGRLNATIAGIADNVILMVSGLPVILKGGEK